MEAKLAMPVSNAHASFSAYLNDQNFQIQARHLIVEVQLHAHHGRDSSVPPSAATQLASGR